MHKIENFLLSSAVITFFSALPLAALSGQTACIGALISTCLLVSAFIVIQIQKL